MRLKGAEKTMKNIFAQFTIAKTNPYGANVYFQEFMKIWTQVTDSTEIRERRLDSESYFEVEEANQIIIEAYFTEEEASHLKGHFPSEFSVRCY